MKKLFIVVIIMFLSLQAHAFEECVITTKGKLTDIKIENNQIINVYPLITIMNNKNTLFVKPLKEGETNFSVLKNGKQIYNFNVKITENRTQIDDVEGFIIQTLDLPPNLFNFKLDEPPLLKKRNNI